jgi:hypothetical protein
VEQSSGGYCLGDERRIQSKTLSASKMQQCPPLGGKAPSPEENSPFLNTNRSVNTLLKAVYTLHNDSQRDDIGATTLPVMKLRLTALIVLTLSLASAARADSGWHDMKTGMNQQDVAIALGQPILVHGSRGYTQWIFDEGGSVMFHRGLVSHWGTPRGFKPLAKNQILIAARTMSHPVKVRATAAETAITEVIVTPQTIPANDPAFIEQDLQNFRPNYQTPEKETKMRSFDEIRKS